MSESIKKLEVVSYVENSDDKAKAEYKINDSTIICVEYPIGITYAKYVRNGGKIIETSEAPSNGFKLVRNKYNQYAYKRLKDDAIIPYLFDYATAFNEHGLAMVAKNGKVSWINKKFEYFDGYAEINDLDELEKIMIGWSAIEEFCEGKIKLSKCQAEYGHDIETTYLGSDFKAKKFYMFNGINKPIIPDSCMCTFINTDFTEFNENGYAFSEDEDMILSSTGYYMHTDVFLKTAIELNEDLFVKTAIENGMLDQITEEVTKDKVFQKK